MVDRITPMTANEHLTILEEDYGIADKWPVVAEDFKQWVIGVSLKAPRAVSWLWQSTMMRDSRPLYCH